MGVGAFIGGLVPSTRTERRDASDLQEKAQPLVDEVTTMAREAGEQLKPMAQEAVASLKETASTVRGEATEAAAEARDKA